MKKTIIALLASAGFVAAVHAQVTISGQFDVGLINPIGAQKTRVDQSANGMNQIVFSGSEDLGGGLRATFRLAQRFSPESGAADGTSGNRPMFQGESTVGLAGGFGALRLGRAVTAFQGPINDTDPWATAQAASLAVLTTGYATAADFNAGSGSGAGRTDGIFYVSPKIGGFTASMTYGLKDSQVTGTTTTGNNSLTSYWLAYNQGAVTAGVGMEENRDGDKIRAVLASYNLGFVRVGTTYAVLNPVASSVDRKSYNVSAVMPIGKLVVKTGIGQSKADNAVASVKKTGLGVDYVLSKRTLIYTSMARDTGSAITGAKTGYDVGIRHSF